jgi:glycosyltransferase involved in cell wall biosynthesis
MIKLTNIISGLNPGGAEILLYNILSRIDRKLFQPEVISLTDIGPIGEKLRAINVPVWALGMARSSPNPVYLLRLASFFQKQQPNLIHTWMCHADLIGGLAAKLAGSIPVVWSIHHSNIDPQGTKLTTRLTTKTCSLLSSWLANQIVCTSQVSQQTHTEIGYAAEKMRIIRNGFDIDRFFPDATARLTIRKELGLAENTPIVGIVARFHPQKDHQNFVRAAGQLHGIMPDVHFLLCGDDVTWENSQLVEWIDTAGIRSCCHLLGRKDNLQEIQASLDVATLASGWGETFPLAIGEAMACGVPCVVTDVGDLGLLIGDTGCIVKPRDAKALAEGWQYLLQMDAQKRQELGLLARQRVQQNFSIDAVVAQYQNLYCNIVGERN